MVSFIVMICISIKLIFFKVTYIYIHTHTKLKTNKKQNLPTKKTPISDGFTGEFHQIFKEALTVIVHKLFPKCEEGKLTISFCEDSITLVPNQTMKRNEALSWIYMKFLNYILVTWKSINVVHIHKPKRKTTWPTQQI